MLRCTLVLLIALASGAQAAAPALKVAVASSFEDTFDALAAAYSKQSSEHVEGTFAATGTLYTEIAQGAPFAALFAADSDRTARLVGEGRAKAASRFVYAIGRVALWTPAGTDAPPAQWLADAQHRVVIADPAIAPYGVAARQTLTTLKLWDALQSRIVVANSAAEALRTVAEGRADGAFVAQGQLVSHYKGNPPSAQSWLVPQTMHEPIVQEAVVLEGPEAARAQAFLTFVASDSGRAIVESGGYAVLAATH